MSRASNSESWRCAAAASGSATPTVPTSSLKTVEVLLVAVVELPVEALLLGKAGSGVVADGGAHVAHDRRSLATGVRSALLDVPAGVARETGRHPVETDPVELCSGELAHLRSHRGEHEPDVAEGVAQGGKLLAHRRQGLLRKAGADAEPKALTR